MAPAPAAEGHLKISYFSTYKMSNSCVAGAFLDFLSFRILKLCSMYFDFQNIERENRNERFSEHHFHFWGHILWLSKVEVKATS